MGARLVSNGKFSFAATRPLSSRLFYCFIGKSRTHERIFSHFRINWSKLARERDDHPSLTMCVCLDTVQWNAERVDPFFVVIMFLFNSSEQALCVVFAFRRQYISPPSLLDALWQTFGGRHTRGSTVSSSGPNRHGRGDHITSDQLQNSESGRAQSAAYRVR